MKSVAGTVPTLRSSEVDKTEVPVLTVWQRQCILSRGNNMSREVGLEP